MANPLVSIALCTYNGEQYLAEQLDSIISQTYQNLEIVVVDDSSSDRTAAIVKDYAGRDSRISYFINENNLGFNRNFEKALSLTSGDFIAISDQDDIWLPDKVNALLKNIDNNWLIFSNSSYIGNAAEGEMLKDFSLPGNYKGIVLHNYVTGHTTLLRRELLGFALPIPAVGYYDWWLGFIAAYHHKIAYLPQALTLHRIHTASVMQKVANEDNVRQQGFEITACMLSEFAGYRHLKPEDKTFISVLHKAYRLSGSQHRPMLLMKMVYKYYEALFPNAKRRRWFSKLNFARKYAKGI